MITMILEFLKTGLFAVGGGLAVLPFLAEFADKYDWFTLDELREFIAVSESIPGPLGVNVVIFAGFAAYGVFGGIVAALALVTPSVAIVNVVSRALDKYRESAVVVDLFAFLRPMSVGLIAGAVFPLITAAIFPESRLNIPAAAVFAAMTVLVFLGEKHKVHPLVFIAGGAVLGIVCGGF